MTSNDKLTLGTKVVLLMHTREAQKHSASGPRALDLLENAQLALYGKQGEPLDLHPLSETGRRVLVLFPSEDARPLSLALAADDARPITLVVPDGNWRQAGRSHRRVPGLEHAERVALDKPNLDTFEALSQALGQLEGQEVQEKLAGRFSRSGPLPSPAILLPAAVFSEPVPLLEILYKDDFLVAVNKPSGLLVHRGWANDSRPVLQLLRDQIGQRVFPLHRLDRATSGVLIFALSSEVARDMQERFESNLVEKRYLALCRGNKLKDQRLSHPLAPEKGAARVPAVTEFRLLGAFERYGLIEAIPHTGRTHQIRKHLKHLAHPIIGDVRYGKGEHNRLFRERFNFSRLALHCQKMSFPHPRSGVQTEFRARLPEDFAGLLKRLGLASSQN